MRSGTVLGCLLAFVSSVVVLGAEDADIPIQAPNDAIMAPPAEVQAVADWVAAALLGRKGATGDREIALEVRRQDHNVLRLGQSCMETPIRIGTRQFAHGLGTHAASIIAVTIPEGAQAFQAMVGIDNNFNTQGKAGSVQFAVEIGGKEVFRTATLRGGDQPVAVDLPLPRRTRQLILKVDPHPGRRVLGPGRLGRRPRGPRRRPDEVARRQPAAFPRNRSSVRLPLRRPGIGRHAPSLA